VSRRVPRDMPRPLPLPLFGGPNTWSSAMWPCGLYSLFQIHPDLMTQWPDANAAKLIGKTHTLRMLNGRPLERFLFFVGCLRINRNRFGIMWKDRTDLFANICQDWSAHIRDVASVEIKEHQIMSKAFLHLQI